MSTTTETTVMEGRLQNFPISFFGASMGTFGLGLALRAAGFEGLSLVVGAMATILFAGLLSVYALKALRYPQAVAAEWRHPVRLAFFPAISISALLLATLIREDLPAFAHAIWIVAAAAQALLTLVVVSTWISARPFGPAQMSPAWFIPAVGNVIVPLAGVTFGHVEVSWYFLSVGLMFWLILLTLVFNRLVFHDPLPGKLQPTLVILIAPPAVAFLAWVQLSGGEPDAMARVLLNAGYFFTALVALQVPALLRLPFVLSFWALSFPLAAITTASFRFASLMGSGLHRAVGFVLLAALVTTVGLLVLRTLHAARKGEICVPE